MTLRAEPARPHDLRGALDLLGRSELTEQDVAERWGHYFVVREDDGRVVGVAGLEIHGEDGLLRSVAVDPDYRGQGLAASLVEAAMERAKRVEAARRVPPHHDGAGLLRAARVRRLPARGGARRHPRVVGVPQRLPLDRGVHEAPRRLTRPRVR